MRTLLISLLLASAAATPAMAAPDDDSAQQTRAERQQAREQARSQRSERVQAVQPERVERVRASRPERTERTIEVRQSFDGPVRGEAVARANARDVEAIRAAREGRRDSAETVRNWRGEERQRLSSDPAVDRAGRTPGAKVVLSPSETRREARQQRIETLREERQQRLDASQINRQLRQFERPLPNVMRTRVPVVSTTPREGTQPPPTTTTRTSPAPNWSTHWRKDKKYDWRDWRRRYWWLFTLGSYYDPFGWRYRPYDIGWRMWPSYYSSRYWLHDPWQYRLPYAPPGYRWIRYWDDAILVDTWTGEVVDVIYNFFW